MNLWGYDRGESGDDPGSGIGVRSAAPAAPGSRERRRRVRIGVLTAASRAAGLTVLGSR
jgi:hypothetical protein